MDLWSAPRHLSYLLCPSLISTSSDPLHCFHCCDRAGTTEGSPTSVPSLKLKLCIIRYSLGLTPLKCASNRSFRTYRLWSEEPFLDMGIMSDTLPWSFNFGLSKRMALQTMVHKSQSSRFICTESEKGDKYKQGKCKFCYPRAETSIVYFFWETCELRKVAHSYGRECSLVDAHPQGEVFKWQIIHYIPR